MNVLESERFANGKCIQFPKVDDMIVLSIISLEAKLSYARPQVITTFVELAH